MNTIEKVKKLLGEAMEQLHPIDREVDIGEVHAHIADALAVLENMEGSDGLVRNIDNFKYL